MRTRGFLTRWLSIAILSVALVTYLNHFSPYGEDGSLNSVIILGAFGVITALSFLVLQSFLSLFLRHQTAIRAAFVISFVLVQVFLISSWGFVDFSSILIVVLFNLFICWYAIKVL